MKNTTLIIAIAAVFLMAGTVCSSSNDKKIVAGVDYRDFRGHARAYILKLRDDGSIEIKSSWNKEHILKTFTGKISKKDAEQLLRNCGAIDVLPDIEVGSSGPGDFPIEFIIYYDDGTFIKRKIMEDTLIKNKYLNSIREDLLRNGHKITVDDTLTYLSYQDMSDSNERNSDSKNNDMIPLVIYLKNESNERPKEHLTVFLDEAKIFDGEVPYTGVMGMGIEELKPIKVKKGSRCFLQAISENSKIESRLIFDLKEKLYIWVEYSYTQDKKIPSFTFVLNDFEGGLD